jgi:hypothetical protein
MNPVEVDFSRQRTIFIWRRRLDPSRIHFMNLFKTFTMKWWQTGIFKAMLLSLGVLLGATWPGIFQAWRPELLGVFIVTVFYICWIWWKQ